MSDSLNIDGYVVDLLVARRLLTEGIEAAAAGDDVRVRTGLLLADLAAESLLKLVARRFGLNTLRKDVPDLIEAVIAATATDGIDVTFLRDLRALRTMRNSVMHDGLGQVRSDAQRRVATARAALTKLVASVFAVDLINLRYNEFVRSPWLKSFLDEATECFDASDHGRALGVCRAAYRQVIAGWTMYTRSLFDLDRREYKAASGAQRDVETVAKHEMAIATMGAGVYLPDLKRFRDATRGVQAQVFGTGRIEIAFTRNDAGIPERRDDAQYALDFVGGLILQVEARLGHPLPPFLMQARAR